MSYVSKVFRNFMGNHVGAGECVEFVKVAAGVPATSQWHRGERVKGNLHLEEGTAIATFNKNGHYENVRGKSHAAIYISQNEDGIVVFDQWAGHPVNNRTIRFSDSSEISSNNGNCYYVIE